MTTRRHIVANVVITHYEEHLAPEWAEHDPTVKVFFDSDCDRLPVTVKLQPGNAEGRYDVAVTGVPKVRPLRPTFAIGFQGYVGTSTKKGVPVNTDAGNGHVFLRDVQEAHRRNRDYVQHIEMRIPSANNTMKGRFTVTIPRDGGLSLGGTEIGKQMTLASRFIGAGANVNEAAKSMNAYTVKCVQLRSSLMKERSRTHSRVRVPQYLGAAGMQLTGGIPIPAAAFMLYEVPKSNAGFWVNAFSNVMARDGYVPGDWPSIDLSTRVQIMKEVICYLPQYLPYKSDTIDRNTRLKRYVKALKTGIEDFEGALEKFCGDCEDLSQAIMSCRDALARVGLEDTHQALRDIQMLARKYMAAMTLCTVTSAAVTGANDTETHLGAHMMVCLFSNRTMYDMVKRGDPRLAERLPFDKQHMDAGLPTLEAEGTGIYYSKQHTGSGQRARQDLYGEPVFRDTTVPIFHEMGTHSPFYREAMTAFVPDFQRIGTNYMGFWYRDANDGARGVPYEDLENNCSNVQLIPHPIVPDDVMEIMKDVTKLRVPPHPLTYTPVPHLSRHPEGERLVKTVNGFMRRPTPANMDTTPASVYTTWSLLTPKVVDTMIATFKRKTGVYKVDYVVEPRVDGLEPGVRITMYDDVEQGMPLQVHQSH